MDSQKKKKPTENQKWNLPTVPRSRRCRDYRENQSLRYWDSLQITIYRAKSKHTKRQKQYTVFIKKNKKKPLNTDSVPKRQNQTKTPIVVVAIAKLAHRCRRLASSSPLIAVADCSLAPHRRSIYSARRLALKNTVIFFLPRDGGEEVLQAHFP